MLVYLAGEERLLVKNILLILLIVLLISSPRIVWQFKEATEIDLLIIDKTVPTTTYREHNGLFWFLTNEKIVKPSGELYERDVDYYGYDPYEKQPMTPYQANGEKNFIYIADTYGVYSDDLEDFSEGERSEKIYGGMERSEWETIMRAKGPNTTLVAEYNSFATPTDEATRTVMEKDLNITWTGWVGRYFDDFTNTEVPLWLIQNYEAQSGEQWLFKNGGLAFVHLSGEVVVLDERDAPHEVKFKMTTEGKQQLPNVNNSTYHYWFDIVEPAEASTVLAQYHIGVSENGMKQLEEYGIPTVFPAVTYHQAQQTYYFSGDFADYTKDNLQRWQYGDVLMRMFSNDEAIFFWTTYIPLMRGIFEQLE